MGIVDRDHVHNALIAALQAIAEGKGKEQFVLVPPFGTQTRIFNALNDAVKYFHEPFHAGDLV